MASESKPGIQWAVSHSLILPGKPLLSAEYAAETPSNTPLVHSNQCAMSTGKTLQGPLWRIGSTPIMSSVKKR